MRQQFTFIAALALLTACGGGGVGVGVGVGVGGTGGSTATALTMTSINTSSADYVALARSSSVNHASLIDKFINMLFPSAFAVDENLDAVAVSSDTVTPIYSTPLLIKEFSIPFSKRSTGHQYITMSGTFDNLTTSVNKTINCNLVFSDFKASGSTYCLYTLKADEAATIPVAIIREGNYEGYYDSNDSIYFVINNNSGGYTLYKYYEGSISTPKVSTTGQITKIVSGNKAIFGYDATQGAGSPVLFGNAQRGFDSWTTPDRVMTYKQFVIFPHRPTDHGNQSVYFTMNDASSTTFATDFSADCENPLDLTYSAEHSYGAFWISSKDGKLCETYELLKRGEPIKFRIVNTEGVWSSVKIFDNKFLGIVTIAGVKRLILDTIAAGGNATQSLTSTRTVDTTQKMTHFNVDDAISIGVYSSGFIVNGSLNGQNVTRYYNATSNALVTPSTVPIELKRKVATNH